MSKEVFFQKGEVKKFPGKGGWTYLSLNPHYSIMFKERAKYQRGFVPATITLGKTTWKSSLLPMGNKTHFIALPIKVRKNEHIALGDIIALQFFLRNR